MEFKNLTICRQDVVIVSDTDSESKYVNLNKNKKRKWKTKCIRNVKLTTMTVNRVAPSCYRQRCRRAQHYHRQTSMNTKYRKSETATKQMKHKKNKAPTKGRRSKCKVDKKKANINMELNRHLYSPITIASRSNTYEDISSCSFNILSSDSDELEDLIDLTRRRMKNESGNFNRFPVRKSVCTTTTQDIYQNISSNDEMLDSSIHSMDTVLLYNGDGMAPRARTPEHLSEVHVKQHNNNNIEPNVMYKNNTNELLHRKIPILSNENNNNSSPLYEISGKVFMEHYLNTSFI